MQALPGNTLYMSATNNLQLTSTHNYLGTMVSGSSLCLSRRGRASPTSNSPKERWVEIGGRQVQWGQSKLHNAWRTTNSMSNEQRHDTMGTDSPPSPSMLHRHDKENQLGQNHSTINRSKKPPSRADCLKSADNGWPADSRTRQG